MIGRIFVAFTVGVLLFGQPEEGLLNRIRSSSLPPEQREAVAASFTAKDYDRVETLLAASTAELKALLGAIEFVGGRMNGAVRAFRQADSLVKLDDRDRFTLAMSLIHLGDATAAR